jgi:hypothetical protein
MGTNSKMPLAGWRGVATLAVAAVWAAALSSAVTWQVLRLGVGRRVRNSIVGYVRQQVWTQNSRMADSLFGEGANPAADRQFQLSLDWKVLQCLANANAASLHKPTLCYAVAGIWGNPEPGHGAPAVFLDWLAERPLPGSVILFSVGRLNFRYSFPLKGVQPDGMLGPGYSYRPHSGVLFSGTALLWCRRMRHWLQAKGHGNAPAEALRAESAMVRALHAAATEGTLRAALVQGNVVSPPVVPIVKWLESQ